VYVSVDEAAVILNVSRRTMWRRISELNIPEARMPGDKRTLVLLSAVEAVRDTP
jgi:excisionase family DNA binding protein